MFFQNWILLTNASILLDSLCGSDQLFFVFVHNLILQLVQKVLKTMRQIGDATVKAAKGVFLKDLWWKI